MDSMTEKEAAIVASQQVLDAIRARLDEIQKELDDARVKLQPCDCGGTIKGHDHL